MAINRKNKKSVGKSNMAKPAKPKLANTAKGKKIAAESKINKSDAKMNQQIYDAEFRQHENLFLINELAYWYVNHKNLKVSHRFTDNDAIVVSSIDKRPAFFDADEILKKAEKSGNIITTDEYSLNILKCLIPQSFEVSYLSSDDDLKNRGFYHHRILSAMLEALKTNFIDFLEIIFAKRKMELVLTADNSKQAYILIKDFIGFLEGIINNSKEVLIPDLFTYQHDTMYMSCRDIRKFFDKDWDCETRYTFLFSRATSVNFATVLKRFMEKKLHDQKEVAGINNQITKYSKDGFSLPGNAADRLKFITGHYNDNEEKSLAKLRYTKGQLMFVFKILQKHKFLLHDTPKEQIVLGISLLTGISAKKLYDLFPAGDTIDFEKIADNKSVHQFKQSILEAINDVNKAFSSEVSNLK